MVSPDSFHGLPPLKRISRCYLSTLSFPNKHEPRLCKTSRKLPGRLCPGSQVVVKVRFKPSCFRSRQVGGVIDRVSQFPKAVLWLKGCDLIT